MWRRPEKWPKGTAHLELLHVAVNLANIVRDKLGVLGIVEVDVIDAGWERHHDRRGDFAKLHRLGLLGELHGLGVAAGAASLGRAGLVHLVL